MPERPPEPPFDPRYDRSRDPRFDPRDDPRFDPRSDPRGDPRFDPRDDPRFDPRYERTDPRVSPGQEPPYDPRYDPRYDAPPERNSGANGAPPPPPPASASVSDSRPRSRRTTLFLVLGLLGLLLVALFAYRLTRSGPGQDRLGEGSDTNAAAADTSASERCGTQQAYDLVKRELFRRAAQERGSEAGAFDRLSAYATVRVEAPVIKRQDEELGTQVCSGRVSIDLPPGVAVVGGRRTLTADVDYALQPAADRTGDVVTLSGAEPIIVPLATLARTGSQPGLPAGTQPSAAVEPQPGPSGNSSPQPAPSAPAPSAAQAPQAPTSPPAASRPATASARPSFNCANARTRGEIAVCNSPELATLDRQMASFYNSAYRNGDAEVKALLQRTRSRFLAFRDQCRGDACIADAYRGRITEIRDIVDGRWRPQR